jgi:hypothetical protein
MIVSQFIADLSLIEASLQRSRAIDAITGVGKSFESRRWDVHLTFLALAEGILVNALQGCRSFRQGLPLTLQQCKRDLLLESVRAQVSGVERHVREISISRPMTGFLRKIEDSPSQAIAHSQELFSKGLHLVGIHWNLMPGARLPRAYARVICS